MIATWLVTNECTEPVTDIELQNLLIKVNKTFDNKYLLSEIVETKGWLRKRKIYNYALYWNTLGNEYQCIDFYTAEDYKSYGISATVIAAYFYGLLNGRKND